jgi:hypothetical protein
MKGSTPLSTLLLGEDCLAFYIYSHSAIFVREHKLHWGGGGGACRSSS